MKSCQAALNTGGHADVDPERYAYNNQQLRKLVGRECEYVLCYDVVLFY